MKTKLKGLLILLLIISGSPSVFSQNNFISGYIIKSKADTVFGLVDYRNWERNPKKIVFKAGADSQPITYTPMDIMEFSTYGEVYKSAIVATENSSTKTDQLGNSPKLKIKTNTAFLQTLIDGEKSLYYYKNASGFENFYIHQDSKFVLLIYKKYLRRENGQTTATENKKYLGQLTLYLSECNTLPSKLENVSYSKKSLSKLFEHYYECTGSGRLFQRKVDKIKLETGAIAGISITSLSFRGDDFRDLENTSYSSSTNIAAGLFLDVVLPRSHGKWSIYNEALVTSFKATGAYEDFRSENEFTRTSVEIGYSYLKFNVFIRYNQPLNNATLFLNAGVSNGFSLSETNYQRDEIRFFSSDQVIEGLVLSRTRKHEQGLVLGAGLKFNKLSLETRFERGNGMSDFSKLKSPTNRFYFLLGYRF